MPGLPRDACPVCGAPLPGGAMAGNCIACLARRLLEPRPPSARGAEPVLRRLGDFELLEEIGRGGMGVVYRARQVSLDRPVAVKLLRDAGLASAEAVRRFHAEAANAARLRHPHIVAVHEVGEVGGLPYLVMDLVEGRDLADLTRAGPLPALRAADLVATLAAAVQHAHERGVLHRDLKPSNVLLEDGEEPRLTDFGVARPIESEQTLTVTGEILGTPGYLAPEQARGGDGIGPAADIHGLGAILFHLLTGRAPFVGGSPAEVLAQVLQEDALSPRTLNPLVPADLAAVCLRCLAKEPAARYASAAELGADLQRFLLGEPTRARPPGPGERVWRWCRRKPALAAAILALHLVGLLGLGGILWQWRQAVHARGRAEAAVRDREEQLWQSRLIDARYFRSTGRMGQRSETLRVVREAAPYRRDLALRDEAIAALLLPDLGPPVWFREMPYGHWPLAFTGDLDFYAPFNFKGRVAVHRASDHAEVALLSEVADRGQTLALGFSPDDRHLAVHFQDGTARVWEWRTGRLAVELVAERGAARGDNGPVFGFSPDSLEVWAGWRGQRLRRLDLASGGELPVAPGLDVRAEGLALHPQGRWLATCEGARVRLWDLGPTPFARPPSPAREIEIVELPGRPGSLAWHPQEPRLAMACQQHGLFLKEPGLPLAVPQGTGPGLTQVLFGPEGDLLLTGAHGGSTVVFDAVELRPLLASSEGFAVRLSRDGRQLAFAVESRGIGVRPVHWPAGWRRLVVPAELGGNTAEVLFLRGGRWMVSSHPFGLAFWETDRAAVGRRLALPHPRLGGVFSNETALLLGTGEGPALLPIRGSEGGPPEPGELRLVWPGARVGFDRVALAPDGDTLAAGGEDGLILTRLSDSGQQTALAGSERPVNYVGFSADGRWLVTGHFRRDGLEVYDVLVGQHSRHLSTGSGAFAFSPDGLRLLHTAASGYGYRRVGTWETLFRRDFAPGAAELMLGNGFIDHGRLALFSDRQARLHVRGVVEDRPLAMFEAFEPTATWGAASDPAGHRLATWSSRRVIHLWEMATLRAEVETLSPGWTADWPAAR